MLNLTGKYKKHTFKSNELFLRAQVVEETVSAAEQARVQRMRGEALPSAHKRVAGAASGGNATIPFAF